MLKTILFLSILLVYRAICVSINFDVHLADGQPNLELECTYTLEKDEVLYKVTLKKDGQTFVKFNDSNKNNPEFTKIDGISDTTVHGGGKVTINNIGDTNGTVYSCNVCYDLKSKIKENKSKKKQTLGNECVSKKYNIKLQGTSKKTCQATWTKAAGPGDVPAGAILIGKSSQGAQLYYCRTSTQYGLTTGFVTTQGCTITMAKEVITQADYEVMTGPGITHVIISKGDEAPDNSIDCGRQQDLTVYCGACVETGDTFIGKITKDSNGKNTFYYAINNQVNSDCTQYYVFMCK